MVKLKKCDKGVKFFVVAVSLFLNLFQGLVTCANSNEASGYTNKSETVKKTTEPSRFLQKIGGFVERPIETRALLYFNMQSVIPAKDISVETNDLIKTLEIPCEFRSEISSEDPLEKAVALLQQKNIGAVIVICDHPKYPSLLLAPESRWAIININGLRSPSKINLKELSQRVVKEELRALVFLTGTSHVVNPSNIFNMILDPKELDGVNNTAVNPEVMAKIFNNLTAFGIKRPQRTTYRKACEEGWAPMPTNSFQKAIWEEVKAKKAVTPSPPATK